MSASRFHRVARPDSGFVTKPVVVEATSRTPSTYELGRPIASGGMATVYLGRRSAATGVTVVAIKRLHPSLTADSKFSCMMLDEARAAARVRHPNVVGLVDVIVGDEPVMLVFEHVLGVTVGQLMRAGESSRSALRVDVAGAIVVDVLRGLHAAHCATDEAGAKLELVHRDVSPQNVIVGADGIARVIDFGIAFARGRAQVTKGQSLRGKAAYIAPERFIGAPFDRRVDVWSAGVLLWEMCTGKRLFDADDPVAVGRKVCTAPIPPTGIPVLDAILARSLARDCDERYSTAAEMARALEEGLLLADESVISAAVLTRCNAQLNEHTRAVRALLAGDIGPKRAVIAIATPSAMLPWPLLAAPDAALGADSDDSNAYSASRASAPALDVDEMTASQAIETMGYPRRLIALAFILALALFGAAVAVYLFAP